eukprot:TRINITY_DN3696_c0_g3_i1.p1 TRINITY_DN3696_c0_g3~~TRINITY_DN3696_c0_g3_i1.p1  ORF type:complete len:499 (+),score=83.37 TRINITY_DN3696_c0_g3_i1:54-1550(+)
MSTIRFSFYIPYLLSAYCVRPSVQLQLDSFSADLALLSSQAQRRVTEYCEKNAWLTLKTCVQPLDDNTTYVITGDIDAMWIRDSAAQLHPYITLAKKEGNHSKLRPLLEGALRRQAQFILTDPYANAFTIHWNHDVNHRLGRGGYVATGNYELDSGAYFFRFLSHMEKAFPSSAMFDEEPIRAASRMMVALYKQEQQHANGKSEYLYPKSPPYELPGPDGQGSPVQYTGMVWGAFRPSDDAQQFGYNIPGNLFLAATLEPLARIASTRWKDAALAKAATELRDSILKGVENHGTTKVDGETVYCYEVDGHGSCSVMDDANVPSLLSLPYLDPDAKVYDKNIYKATRGVILSEKNPWFFAGAAAAGIGSPHTGDGRIWPMSLIMQAMTTDSKEEKQSLVNTLAESQMSQSGLVESFSQDAFTDITRPWFGWPNALLAEHLMKEGSCNPSLRELDDIIPATRGPPLAGPLLAGDKSFYTIDPAKIRRDDVTLPADDFYPA